MLHRLIQTAASTFNPQPTPRPQAPLESITEESHTRDLLYPDPNAHRPGQPAGSAFHAARPPATAREAANYDDRGGLEVSYPGDIRIIVAQDANARYDKPQVLYDSKPCKTLSRVASPAHENEPSISQRLSARGKATTTPVPAPTPGAGRRHHAPSASVFSTPHTVHFGSPTSPRSPESRFAGVFGQPRPRASPFAVHPNDSESAQAKLARESREETDALLNCMFGAPGFRLEPGTKIHVLPKKTTDEAPTTPRTPYNLRPASSSEFQKLRTPLVRSTSAAEISREPTMAPLAIESKPATSKSAIMFTRLFQIHLPDTPTSDAEELVGSITHAVNQESPDQTNAARENKDAKPPVNIKQKKVPMYAIAIILQLPADHHQLRTKTPSHQGISSLGSSYAECTPGSSWTAESNSAFASIMEARRLEFLGSESLLSPYIARTMSHWNILCRNLEFLELAVRPRLIEQLDKAAPSIPLMAPPPARAGNPKMKRSKQPTQQSVYVMAECFQGNLAVAHEVDQLAQRTTSALRIRRAVAGQNRWGAWREEARWVSRWAGGRDQNFFFFILLTAFLGSHTTWLDAIGPLDHRIRQERRKRVGCKETSRLYSRTVIVASDKMAARRLIFTLSAFLPPTKAILQSDPVQQMMSQSAFMDSPTSPSNREHSLRRSINQGKSNLQKSKSDIVGHARSVSFSLLTKDVDNANPEQSLHSRIEQSLVEDEPPKQERANWISTGKSRKSSISTTLADPIGIPHFSNMAFSPPADTTPVARPGSGGSLASFALSSTLKRTESSNLSNGSSAGGKWGGVVSGFWGGRKDSSSETSDVGQLSNEVHSSASPRARVQRSSMGANKLSQMVGEVSKLSSSLDQQEGAAISVSPGKPLNIEDYLKKPRAQAGEASSIRTAPRRPKPERLPLKLSYDEKDGYIDVSLPHTLSFSSSLTSSFASLRFSGLNAGSQMERHSQSGSSVMASSMHTRPDPVVDVAGWLKSYHPDFALQAVRPYDKLRDDVKQSMRAEASLSISSDHASLPSDGTWTDVCTVLIADASKFVVERLSLRQRQLPPETKKADAAPSAQGIEEEFVVEQVMDLDATLIDAVERVVMHSSTSTRIHSRVPSPARSRANSVRNDGGSIQRVMSLTSMEAGSATPALEVPHIECGKMVLGALQDVVKSVIEEQHQHQHQHQQRGEANESRQTNGKHASQASSVSGNAAIATRVRDSRRQRDSSLREGVRKWLLDIEHG